MDANRGAYVAAVAGCATCHGKDLSGGKEAPLGAGVWRASNLTPSALGTWTKAEIIAAIRDGVRPDGTRLAPIMPYEAYHHMTDADADAVVAYLRRKEPVAKTVARSENLPMTPPELGPVDRTDPDDAVGHGRYLATLMHCFGCHGADGSGGMAFAIAGKTTIAPNITSDTRTGIGLWSEAAIIRAVRNMRDDHDHAIHPPMSLYAADWARLTDRDAHALALYVQSLPPVRHEVEPHQRVEHVAAGAER